jgi:hypothetical protein
MPIDLKVEKVPEKDPLSTDICIKIENPKINQDLLAKVFLQTYPRPNSYSPEDTENRWKGSVRYSHLTKEKAKNLLDDIEKRLLEYNPDFRLSIHKDLSDCL